MASRAGSPAGSRERGGTGFHHSAFVYADDLEYALTLTSYIRDGLANDERVLVVVDPGKIQLLRGALGSDADEVRFANMHEVGRNPARIIPLWRDFIDTSFGDGRGARGVGEPVHVGRSSAEFAECIQHEALLNVAFDEGPGWSLMCPYDAEVLSETAIEAAHHTHPIVGRGSAFGESHKYHASSGSECLAGPPLPDPPPDHHHMFFGADDVRYVRGFVGAKAAAAGLDRARTVDLTLAASEIVTNSILHGGGSGIIRIWSDQDSLVCEVCDAGRITDGLAGRRRPSQTGLDGRGLWLANTLCDLVQLRSTPSGNVIRLHISLSES